MRLALHTVPKSPKVVGPFKQQNFLPRRRQQRRGWRLMIFRARATRGRRLPSLDARSGSLIRPYS